MEECYEVWNGLRDELEQYYKAKPRVRHPLSEQKEFRVIKNVIVQEAEQLWQELEQTPQQKTEQDAQVEADSEEETQNDLLRETREIRTTSKVHSAPNPAVALDLGLSRSTVKRALKELEDTGWIRKRSRYRENGSSTSNLYTILR